MVLGKPKKAKPPPGDLAAVAEDGDGGAPSKKKRRAKEPDGKWAHVPSDELAAYRALFDEIDADGSGGIDRSELRKSMRKKFGMKLPEERIDEVFDAVDEDGNGELDFDEFVGAMVKFKPSLDESGKSTLKSGVQWLRREGLRARLSPEQLSFYKDAFGTMDDKGKGAVNASQFFDLIKFIGVETNIKTVRKLMREADADGNGELDFDEFLEMIARRDDGDGLRKSATGLGEWKSWFKNDVQLKISEIEAREKAERARAERTEVAMRAVRSALSQEQIDHFAKKWAELLEPVELKDRGLDAPAIAAGLVRDGDLDKKEARREAKACVAVGSLDDDKARVSWEAFLHAMATKKEGWHVWWRGDKIQKDTKSFDASGGVGLMGAISDERLRLATEKKRAEIEAEDAREESALVAKMRRLRAKREAQAQQQQEIDKELEPQSPRVLPPILAQMPVYSDDEGASPRAELLGGVRRFLHDAVVRAEAADSDTAKMAATGATSTTTIGIALDARSMFLYGRAYPPGPPPDFNPPSETGEDRDPEAVATFLMKASRPAPRPPKAEDGEDQGDVDAVTSNMPGRLSGFGSKLSMGEANGAPAADGGDSDGDGDGAAPPEEPRDTVLESFRDKMKRDLVLLMAYQQHVGALPVNLKKLCKQLWLFDWPKLGLLCDGVIDDLQADGVICRSVDQNNRPRRLLCALMLI
ncbi:Ca2-binding protein [Aureococcus anophagefferens]|nr:Ca2-binding protein [Aureococcus anophagefferens]